MLESELLKEARKVSSVNRIEGICGVMATAQNS